MGKCAVLLGVSLLILSVAFAHEKGAHDEESWEESEYHDIDESSHIVRKNPSKLHYAKGDKQADPAISEEELATRAIKATMDAAGLEEDVKAQALAQLSMKTEAKTAAPVSCQVWAGDSMVSDIQKDQSGRPAPCTDEEGKPVYHCVTNEITLQLNGGPKALFTSNCDKMRLCDGMKQGFYKIPDGQCGQMPGKGGQKIYCSKTTPEKGRIPANAKCNIIKMNLGGEATTQNEPSRKVHKKHNAAGQLVSNFWVMLATTLTVFVLSR